jgi:hypothetical protein
MIVGLGSLGPANRTALDPAFHRYRPFLALFLYLKSINSQPIERGQR